MFAISTERLNAGRRDVPYHDCFPSPDYVLSAEKIVIKPLPSVVGQSGQLVGQSGVFLRVDIFMRHLRLADDDMLKGAD